MNILVVEDDRHSADFLSKTLQEERYRVTLAYSFEEAKQELDANIFSLILLDWQLGDGSGYDLLKQFREEGMNTPVIMLTSQSDVEAKAAALDAGADDYITKPFSTIELLARIRAILRRESKEKQTTLTVGSLELDMAKHEIRLDGEVLDLTVTEYNLLQFLMQNRNTVLSRYQINEYIMKDFASIGNSNIVDVHIKNIRKKLGEHKVIKTIRGVGYMLEG